MIFLPINLVQYYFRIGSVQHGITCVHMYVVCLCACMSIRVRSQTYVLPLIIQCVNFVAFLFYSLFLRFFSRFSLCIWAHVICYFRWFPLSHAVDWLVGWFGRRISIRFSPQKYHSGDAYKYIDGVGNLELCCCCYFGEKKKIYAQRNEHCTATPSFNRCIDEPFPKFDG